MISNIKCTVKSIEKHLDNYGRDPFETLQHIIEVAEVLMFETAILACARVRPSAGIFLGSAFYYDSQGYLLTAFHVIADTQKNNQQLFIEDDSGRQHVAEVKA